jgi:hypothetical protein
MAALPGDGWIVLVDIILVIRITIRDDDVNADTAE